MKHTAARNAAAQPATRPSSCGHTRSIAWPGDPLPDEYDLLSYAKNGHRPQLLAHLAEVFPCHIQIH